MTIAAIHLSGQWHDDKIRHLYIHCLNPVQMLLNKTARLETVALITLVPSKALINLLKYGKHVKWEN